MADDYSLVPERDENGNETGYYTREPDGVSGMTVSALAGFCGTDQPVITNLLNRIETSDPISNDLADCLKPLAGKDWRLISNDLQGRRIIPDEACYAIAEYYVFEARQYDGKEIATTNFRSIARAGMRVFIWTRTGFIPPAFRQPEVQPIPNTSVYIKRLENMRDHEVDYSLWTTFREGAEVLLFVEKELRVPVEQMDLCDGSIGIHWKNYRKDQPWADIIGSYFHLFRDQRGRREANAYRMNELPFFKQWLQECYYPVHLPQYLVDKYGKRAIRQVYGEIEGLTDHILQITEEGRRFAPQQERLYQNFLAARQRLLGGSQ